MCTEEYRKRGRKGPMAYPFHSTGKTESVVSSFQIGPICGLICLRVRTPHRYVNVNLNLCANAAQIRGCVPIPGCERRADQIGAICSRCERATFQIGQSEYMCEHNTVSQSGKLAYLPYVRTAPKKHANSKSSKSPASCRARLGRTGGAY